MYNDKLVKFVLISAGIGLGVSYSSLYLFHIALVLFIIYKLLIIAKSKKIKRIMFPSKFHYLFILIFMWYVCSLIWTISVVYTLQYLFYIFCGLSILLVLIFYAKDVEKLKKVFKLLAVLYILQIVIGLFEAFTGFRYPISPYSQYAYYFGRSVGDFSGYNDFQVKYINSMPTGFQWNPNNFAATMNILLPYFLLNQKLLVKFAGLISVVLLVITTGSRANFIATMVILILYAFIFNKYLKAKIIIFISIPLVILVAFLLLNNMLLSDNIKIREAASSINGTISFFTDDNNEQNSIGIRQQLIKNGIKAFIDSNSIGVGGGASKKVQELAGNTNGITSMHNFWIEILVEGGLFLFIICIIWYLSLLMNLWKVSRNKSNKDLSYFSKASGLSLIGFIFGAVSASSVVYMFPMWLLFGFSIATINVYRLEMIKG